MEEWTCLGAWGLLSPTPCEESHLSSKNHYSPKEHHGGTFECATAELKFNMLWNSHSLPNYHY